MTDPTAIEIAEAVRSGERSAREVLGTYLARIDTGNEALNAFVHVDPDLAGGDLLVDPGRSPGSRSA